MGGEERSNGLTPSGLPRKISNPEIGDVLAFVEVAGETDGDRVVVEITLAPGGGNPMHIHLRQTETSRSSRVSPT